MKTLNKLIICSLAALLLAACKKDFLNRLPESDISPQTFFNTETDLQLYTNSFYAYLPADAAVTADFSSDNVDVSAIDELVSGTRRVPTDATSGGWTWTQLYNINYLLQNYNKPSIPQEARSHYAGVARFFRAFFYFEKLKRFGDVPFYNHPLDEQSVDLYKPRDPRTLVVDSILADLDWAAGHMRTAKDAARANKWDALALKSRVCLFEGTFRKYHTELNLQSTANALLQLSADAANTIITNSPYKLSTGTAATVYLNLFSAQTPNADEFMLSTLYSLAVNKGQVLNALFTSPTRMNPGLTKSLIDSYQLADGRSFSALANYQQMPFWTEVNNRDPRLSQTMRTPGYRRIGVATTTTALLPDYANAYTGYQNIKFVSTPDQDGASYTPIPMFRFAEVLLNYAEAKAELGQLTQAEADKSINLVKARVGLPKLDVATATIDPILAAQYTHVTDPLILEVRRERRVELVMEGFRFYDLVRWKEGHLLAEKFRGAYYPSKGTFDLDNDGKYDIAVADTKPSPAVAGLQYFVLLPDKALSNGSSGNIIVHANQTKTFREDRDYYYPLPLNELLLNPSLKQNPNW